eukprot:g66018.t1
MRQVIVELCAPFGIGISKEFMIKEIEPCRNAARWNEHNPDRKVVPGHRITAVRDHLGRWLEAESLTMVQLKFLLDAPPLRAIVNNKSQARHRKSVGRSVPNLKVTEQQSFIGSASGMILIPYLFKLSLKILYSTVPDITTSLNIKYYLTCVTLQTAGL